MEFSVIIPAKDAPQEVARLLAGLKRQSLRPQEVLVVDSSPEEETKKVALRFGARVLKIEPEDFNHGLTRTLAARQARGEILVFFTQDAWPAHRRALENLLSPLAKGIAAAAYGRQVAPLKQGFLSFLHRLYNYPPRSRLIHPRDIPRLGIRAAFFSNSFAAYHRSSLEEVGYFPRLPALEDQYVAARLLLAGRSLAYVARAVVFHGHSFRLQKDFSRYRSCGAFYRENSWILAHFGHPQREGWRYLRFAWNFLKKRGKLHLLPAFFFQQGARYLAFWWGMVRG